MNAARLRNAAKIVVTVGVLAYLLMRLNEQDGFSRIVAEPKHWPSLAAALALVLLGFSLNFTRWYLLVVGLGIPFKLTDAFRLGSLGVMLSQVTPGSLGGDVIKGVFIAREQPGRRAEAVATIVIDRVVGLYAMLLVTSVGLIVAEATTNPGKVVRSIEFVIWIAAAVGTAGIAAALSNYASHPNLRGIASAAPLISDGLHRVIDALESYRLHRRRVLTAIGLAAMTHISLILAFWFIGRGLPVQAPTLVQNCWIAPVSMVIGAIPGLPGGLGQLESAIEYFYQSIGAPAGDGVMVALAFRGMVYVMAAAGGAYYFSAKKKVNELFEQAEHMDEQPT
ncbi:MAG: lysylphosphatidylglycerol synthase transmembrane domain-containing protein [Planctomycetota bacterium]